VGRGEAAVPSAAATSEVGSDLGRRERISSAREKGGGGGCERW
jgi:hypothetical protein